ncbi:plasmid segregation protein ParM [Halobacillus karajensis]|uniref:Plasmid segregation protein ParM n=1 Tax=Halobacillus karajensis TaxID=195088 RepID=A0A059NX53_9BACI|nr:ParM/StbA family protein [Halobacillus karajensis]CDQ18593.1 plasmid segregation protein ParM [Halobacillus karajensis]CDQ23335.1 plasmid segregation protein ParM [Halobacillus karajensis]CDQ26817.1 plasmid segregation protein ParM [Halobacillus karajensis]SEH49435.1 plasmid segregation protein ParM [Halobacillus karajensis]
MTKLRIAAVDVGNDAVKANFGKLESSLYIPNVVARDLEDRPVIGIEDLDDKDPLDNLHIRVHSPALHENNAIYRVGNLATKTTNSTELDPGSYKSEEDQTLIMLFASIAMDAVTGKDAQSAKNNVIEANYTLGTGLPLREVKEGKDVGYRSQLLGSVHQVEFLVTPKYQGMKVNIKFDEVKVYPEGFAAYVNLVMDNDLNIINKELVDKQILIQDIGGLSTDIAVIRNRNVDDDKAQGYNLGVSESLEMIRDEILTKHGVELDSRRDVVDIITRKNDRHHIMVRGSRTNVHDITDRILLELAKKQYRYLRNVWQKNSQSEICYFVGGGSAVLKEYIKTLNNKLDGFNIDFFEDEDESIWMMANAYYKLISDFIRKNSKLDEKPNKKVEQKAGSSK